MSEQTFMASSYWRGALNVNDMRTFPTVEQALDYVRDMPYHRVYELFNDKPPVIVSAGTNRSKA